jgi:hypothetical protein
MLAKRRRLEKNMAEIPPHSRTLEVSHYDEEA